MTQSQIQIATNERPESPARSVIVLALLSGVIVFAALIVFTTSLYHDVQQQEVIEKWAIGNREVRQKRDEQLQQLNEYRWIDRASGIVGIPVEHAIELLLSEREGESPNAAD